MIKSAAIYPEVISDKYLKQIKEYISLLDSYKIVPQPLKSVAESFLDYDMPKDGQSIIY